MESQIMKINVCVYIYIYMCIYIYIRLMKETANQSLVNFVKAFDSEADKDTDFLKR